MPMPSSSKVPFFDDLNVDCLVNKYVDDTTLTEVVQRSMHSKLFSAAT